METTSTKKKSLLVAVVCALALCLSMVLVGCGGSSSGGSSEDYSKNFIGEWNMVSVGSDDEEKAVSEEDMEMLKDLDMKFILTVKEDKTCSLEIFGEDTESGTWKADSATECIFTMDGQAIKGTLEDGQLTLAQEGTTLVFTKK